MRIPCVGAVVHDGAGRLLLVLRRNPPGAGTWSLPGGRVEAGEDERTAVAREVREETGLVVSVGDLVGRVSRDSPDGHGYDIGDYRAAVTDGELVAGDDAADARWAGRADLAGLRLSDGLAEQLEAWGVLPD